MKNTASTILALSPDITEQFILSYSVPIPQYLLQNCLHFYIKDCKRNH